MSRGQAGFYYITLEGERLNLRKLGKKHRELLRKFFKLYQEERGFVDFSNAMNSPDSLKIMGALRMNGQYWIGSKVLRSIIFSVLQDLCNRLAIKQGFSEEGKERRYMDFAENEKALNEFLTR
ncbi:MAG: hypothetical protein HYY55_01810 [Candidatus Niyogibacteria bacterium]|nr:MAG: hypothetical protein HYY55_01810 [Candidatus Niyogibacteria bacterium]